VAGVETIRGEIGETVAGVELDNNTGSTKPEHNEQGRKIHHTVLKCLFTMGTYVSQLARGCVTFQRRDYQL